jgi:hypothetical protein
VGGATRRSRRTGASGHIHTSWAVEEACGGSGRVRCGRDRSARAAPAQPSATLRPTATPRATLRGPDSHSARAAGRGVPPRPCERGASARPRRAPASAPRPAA